MSIVTIQAFQDILNEVENHLSEEIHRTFKPDTLVELEQKRYEVVGPYDKFKINLRSIEGTPTVIDGYTRRYQG